LAPFLNQDYTSATSPAEKVGWHKADLVGQRKVKGERNSLRRRDSGGVWSRAQSLRQQDFLYMAAVDARAE